jgi:pyruvate kinase
MSRPQRGTSIIATIGPAVEDEAILDRLISSGVSVLRINGSHGDRDSHNAWFDRIRAAEARAKRPIGILFDLPGPKLRLKGLEDGPRVLEAGDSLILGETSQGTDLQVTVEGLLSCLAPGHRVLIDDGMVRLLVESIEGDRATCRVMTAGTVSQGKGVNLPDSNPPLQVPTERDLDMAVWAVSRGVDFLAQSFVGDASQLKALRKVLPMGEGQVILIAKIERPIAVDNLESIVQEADAVMVARGDLGVEMEIATVPMVQRRILEATQRLGRPCIVATQMLQSMIESASPTRAEAGDVSTAIRDGADAVMLSGETSIGAWPDLTVSTMARIAEVTEASTPCTDAFPKDEGIDEAIAALCEATWSTIRRVQAGAMLCRSRHGVWAARLSRARLGVPIVAVTDDMSAARRMTLLRDVIPVMAKHLPEHGHEEDWLGLTQAQVRRSTGLDGTVQVVVVGAGSGDFHRPALHLAIRTLED